MVYSDADNDVKSYIEKYKEEIRIQESSHVIVVDHLTNNMKIIEAEIIQAKGIINKSLDELTEKLHMIQADRETHLNELLALRLRQKYEEEMREKKEAETKAMLQKEKEQERKERMAIKIQNIFRVFTISKEEKSKALKSRKSADKEKTKKTKKNNKYSASVHQK